MVTKINATETKNIDDVYKEKNKNLSPQSLEGQILQQIFKD